MRKQLSGFKPGETIMGHPVGQPNEGHGIYAAMEQTNSILQRDMELIHDRLEKKGIYPSRITPGETKRPAYPYSWEKTK